jgi:molybdopterin molybdotransferase
MTADLATARRLAYEEGRRTVVPAEPLPLAAAAGRTLAEPVIAQTDLPPFDAAAMDGWMVAGPGPWRLGPLIEVGSAPLEEPIAPGTAHAIATGAPVPPGTSALLRAERGRVAHGQLAVLDGAARPTAGADLRVAGSEARAGAVVLAAGLVLSPARLAAAAAASADEVAARRVPAVDLVVTGDELAAVGLPGAGEVRDAIGPAVPALVSALGGSVATAFLIGDGLEALERLARAAEGELLVTAGGTAAGPTDHARDALEALECELLVDGIAMRPGHPTLLARRPDGRLVLCLPGNPHAALVALALVGGPAIAGLLGRPAPVFRSVVASADLPFAGGSRGGVRVVPARYDDWGVVPVDSPLVHGLAEADVLVIVPAGGAVRGDVLDAFPL